MLSVFYVFSNVCYICAFVPFLTSNEVGAWLPGHVHPPSLTSSANESAIWSSRVQLYVNYDRTRGVDLFIDFIYEVLSLHKIKDIAEIHVQVSKVMWGWQWITQQRTPRDAGSILRPTPTTIYTSCTYMFDFTYTPNFQDMEDLHHHT